MIMQLSNVTVPSLLTSKTLCLSQDADPSFLLQHADNLCAATSIRYLPGLWRLFFVL